ncbi:MAG: hypothetical protein MUF34_37510 [Polyangiaceae bacterium]|nr:hypothetical protein [Polyangiaceae bacterium]
MSLRPWRLARQSFSRTPLDHRHPGLLDVVSLSMNSLLGRYVGCVEAGKQRGGKLCSLSL